MAGLATEAGVSRQLVYGHFDDVEALYVAFVEDRLARYRSAAPDIAGRSGSEAAATMFQHLLGIPPTDRRVVRLLVADVGIPALERVRRRFLTDELGRWGRAEATPGDAAVVWATTSALLAIADSVDAQEIAAARGEAMAVRIVEAARTSARR